MLALHSDRRFENPRDRDDRHAADEAKTRNAHLIRFGHTKFKVGQVVMLRGQDPVRIVAAEPVGYVSSPGSWGYRGGWCPAIINEREIYRYVHVGPKAASYQGVGPDRWHGQTTGDELAAMPTVASVAPTTPAPARR